MLLHDLITRAKDSHGAAIALSHAEKRLTYEQLWNEVGRFSGHLLRLGIGCGERVAIYLEKRFENVVACFGTTTAGAVFVPINPVLKVDQVAHILRDCNVRVLFTSGERLRSLGAIRERCPDLRHILLVEDGFAPEAPEVRSTDGPKRHRSQLAHLGHRRIDSDMAAIFYTSGSTGKPKGVILSHRNLVAGAESVASYLENSPDDALLAALPLSFDAGFSQLTTAFHAGARVALLNYLLPRDVLSALDQECITGFTAVPPLYIQLTQVKQWPEGIKDRLRYFANTGGHMPRDTLAALRRKLPKTKPYLMYGLTEAFRSTYLPPEEIDRRPDSIGKAIPNAEVLVLRPDGSPCGPGEPGELVHRGALVAHGYWNDPERTAERFKVLALNQESGLPLPEIAVFSGDTVRLDDEGFIYFVGRRDEMIKTSGYRVSPEEVEELLYATGLVGECVAFGVPHSTLGHSIRVIVTPVKDAKISAEDVLLACRARMPAYMVPAQVDIQSVALPRNPNGKLDRKSIIAQALATAVAGVQEAPKDGTTAEDCQRAQP